MPRRVNVDEENLSWLKANHSRLSHKELASKFNCCVDTIKRILVRHNLQDFDGAKYQVKRTYEEKTWQRPCMDCGDTKKRPKNWYYCIECRGKRGYEEL